MPIIQAGELRTFAEALLTAGGFDRADAVQMTDLLVWANLRGVDSHGVLRIPYYLEMLERQSMTTGGPIVTAQELGAICILDGGGCPGAVGMNAALDRAAGLSRQFSIGWCGIRAISHAGAIGYFTEALASRGLIGIAMTAAKPLMSYFGARGAALCPNPLSIAVPVDDHPVLLDMSTGATALGRILAAKDAGHPIPEDWGVDENGVSTTDPARVAAIRPMAGAKGSGLSLMIEMLTSVLAGNAVIAPVLAGLREDGFNGTVIALDPAAFGDPAGFAAEIRRLARAIHDLPPAEGNSEVLLPGQRGAVTARRRTADGIPLAPGTVERLLHCAWSLGVAAPACLMS